MRVLVNVYMKTHDCVQTVHPFNISLIFFHWSGIKMNAIFSEKDFAVYVPLFCTKCHSKKRKRRLVGLRTARIGTPKSQSKVCKLPLASLFSHLWSH